MNSDQIQILIAMGIYMVVIVVVGILYAKKANENSDNFFLGGRSLGPWVAAMSAEASDMSGWLLMGLPGLAYWCGLANAFWTALGLAVGTYLNWLIVSKRLRNYSIVSGNAITLPEFFSNRFKEKRKIIQFISSAFILVFFIVYTASCFVTFGKLFSTLFNIDYELMMVIGALFVIAYTFLGGFLAESVSDFIQGIVMIVALVAVLGIGIYSAGGLSNVFENARNMPGFLEFFTQATPVVDSDNIQTITNNVPQFGASQSISVLSIISTMAWGLGYFGMPQVLLRFMGIRKTSELKKSRRIAVVWVVISLAAAVFIGVLGRALYPDVSISMLTESSAENIFVATSTRLLPPLIAGIVMSGILAATMSSSDSYLLIASSAVSRDMYKGIFKKNASDKQVMKMSRIVLIIIALIGMIIALDENSIIFKIVSFAWAGFGATFGPLVLFSLFWKRTTRGGAIAGMLSGGVTVFLWKLLISKLGGVFEIYELFPAFVISCIFIVAVSLLSKEPSKEIQDEFIEAKKIVIE